MANYYCTSRTNYFRVKDEPAFVAWAEKFQFEAHKRQDGLYALFPGDVTDDGSFPSSFYDEEKDEDEEFDFMVELSKHLAEGSVAVCISAGAEKLRYVSGYAEAINSKGERAAVRLDDIYVKAAALGEATLAEY